MTAHVSTTRRASLYLRVSTTTKSRRGEVIAFEQDPAVQERPLRDLIAQRGWTLCRVYSAQVESGAQFTPIAEGEAVSKTGVMLTASGLLRAANLAVFELGMWQSWTGR